MGRQGPVHTLLAENTIQLSLDVAVPGHSPEGTVASASHLTCSQAHQPEPAVLAQSAGPPREGTEQAGAVGTLKASTQFAVSLAF